MTNMVTNNVKRFAYDDRFEITGLLADLSGYLEAISEDLKTDKLDRAYFAARIEAAVKDLDSARKFIHSDCDNYYLDRKKV